MKIPGRYNSAPRCIIFRKCSNFLFMNCLNMCVCLWLSREEWIEVRRGSSSGLISAWFNLYTLDTLLQRSLRLEYTAFYCINVFFLPLFRHTPSFSQWVWYPRLEHLFGWTTKCHLFLESYFWRVFNILIIALLLSCQDDANEILQCLKMSFNMNLGKIKSGNE